MKQAARCLPIGALPYENLDTATTMQAKLFEQIPYLAFLPKIDKDDNIYKRTFSAIPGIKVSNKKVVLKANTNSFKQNLLKLDKAYNNPTLENLNPYAIESPFLEKFANLVKKFKPQYACINLLGPFTVSQILVDSAEAQTLTDKSFRKLFIQAVCIKALWFIEKLKEYNRKTKPIIILEEPTFSQFGMLKRENEEITPELVTNLFARVIEKLQEAGAIVAIQCFEKCNWQLPIKAGVDIISYDAYNNPNNLSIMPDDVIEFIKRGGKINWGIVPTLNENLIKSTSIDYMCKRLFATFDGVVLSGVPVDLVYNSSLVSIQGDTDHLPVIFAEKAIMLATQLSKRIPIVN